MEFDMHGTTLGARDEVQRAAREKAYATPLSEFHPGNPELFRSDTQWPYFERPQRTTAAGRTRRVRDALNQTCQMPPTCEKGDAPMTELAAVASRSWLFP
jgi:hypothetical protein